MQDALSYISSPYLYNPLNYNLLREVLEEVVDFERLRGDPAAKLFLWATNVRFGIDVCLRDEAVDGDCRSMTDRNTPRLRRWRVSLAKKPSTALSQDAEVGGEVERPAGMPRKPSQLVRRSSVEHYIAPWKPQQNDEEEAVTMERWFLFTEGREFGLKIPMHLSLLHHRGERLLGQAACGAAPRRLGSSCPCASWGVRKTSRPSSFSAPPSQGITAETSSQKRFSFAGSEQPARHAHGSSAASAGPRCR
jgi:hypothetical protein